MPQKKLEETTRFGRTLVRLGHINEDQLANVLEEQRARTNGVTPKLGDIAIEMGICTQDEVEEALEHQGAWRGPELQSKSEEALGWMQEQARAVSHMADDFQKVARKTKTATMTVVKVSPEA